MAYADFDFYQKSYYGDVLTAENANKWLARASDELDAPTFGRLTFAFPTIEAHAAKVKKAVCAIAEALFYIDAQRAAASAQLAADGSYRGAVASISSGRCRTNLSSGLEVHLKVSLSISGKKWGSIKYPRMKQKL